MLENTKTKKNDSQSSIETQQNLTCPQCMGAKYVFNGKKTTACGLCKQKGEVNEFKYNHFINNIGKILTNSG